MDQVKLKTQLRTLGLETGDLVMVHASLRRLGPVEGRAHGVIKAIRQTIGETGTMLMPLGSCEGDIFVAEQSVVDPGNGVLAEQFRQYAGIMVNDHPAARFGAIGPAAYELLRDLPLHDYYGEASILERFTIAKGKVLRLGADKDTTTLTHYAEYLAKVSPKRSVTRIYEIKNRGSIAVQSLDDSAGIQDWPNGDYFSKILDDYLGTGRANRGIVGVCYAELLDAQDYVSFAIDWMEKNLKKS